MKMSYQKSNKKRLNSFIAIVLLIIVMATPISFANQQSQPAVNPYTGTGDLSVIKCISQGKLDFVVFLRTMISTQGPIYLAIELWRDVLARNQCHSEDILHLLKQSDKLRSAIRQAFLTCSTHKLPGLKIAYNEILAEIYYIRNLLVADGIIVVSLPFSILSARWDTRNPFSDDRDLFDSMDPFTDSLVLYNDMRQKFVKNHFFTEDEFNRLYLTLDAKYRDRKNSYVFCRGSGWDEVRSKWEEFKTFFTEDIGEQFSAGISDLQARSDQITQEAKTIKTFELIKGDLSLKDYMKSFVKVNLDGDEFSVGMDRIKEQFEGSTPGIMMPVTQSTFFDQLEGAQKVYEIEKIRKDLGNEFANIYLTMADQTGEILLNTLDGRGVTEYGLIEILEETIPILYNIKTKVSRIHKKQCN